MSYYPARAENTLTSVPRSAATVKGLRSTDFSQVSPRYSGVVRQTPASRANSRCSSCRLWFGGAAPGRKHRGDRRRLVG